MDICLNGFLVHYSTRTQQWSSLGLNNDFRLLKVKGFSFWTMNHQRWIWPRCFEVWHVLCPTAPCTFQELLAATVTTWYTGFGNAPPLGPCGFQRDMGKDDVENQLNIGLPDVATQPLRQKHQKKILSSKINSRHILLIEHPCTVCESWTCTTELQNWSLGPHGTTNFSLPITIGGQCLWVFELYSHTVDGWNPAPVDR